MDDPVVIRAGGTIEDVAHAVHRSLVSHFASALVWGQSSKPDFFHSKAANIVGRQVQS